MEWLKGVKWRGKEWMPNSIDEYIQQTMKLNWINEMSAANARTEWNLFNQLKQLRQQVKERN